MKQTNNMLKSVREQRRLIRDAGPDVYSYTERANRLAKLEETERIVMARFNGLYEAIRGTKEN